MQLEIWNSLSPKQQTEAIRRPVYTQKDKTLEETIRYLIADIREQGDKGVMEYARDYDDFKGDSFKVDQAEIKAAAGEVDEDLKNSIRKAYDNIERFHEEQGYQPYDVDVSEGIKCSRIVRPIERVGLYIPAGSAPLFSTVLMVAIPASIAGCTKMILCSPPGKDGKIDPAILFAADLCGIDQIFCLGGAQAIAAMAYGTETIPKVDKIFGPGNQFVTEAKKQVSIDPEGALLDMPAGPSEVCVIADETTPPVFAAADLLSQAEHDTMSQVLLITTSADKGHEIIGEVEKQLESLPRKNIAAKAIENSLCMVAESLEQAVQISNRYAPEHLILCFEKADQYIDQVINAGSIFAGIWTPESAGDYASGTNHVLPTYGYARAASGLSVEAFQKTMTVQSITRDGLQSLGGTVVTMAEAEGLDAHARAILLRTGEVE